MSDISNILLIVVAFIVAISVLVSVHEFGHYWVARRLGVKVLRFSIGFGNPLWRYTSKDADHVEYLISSIPLGGYVKMLDEREGEVAPEELHRAFNRQPVAKRFAIVVAGPVLNLLFAIFAFWLMFMNGVPGIKPELGPVPAESYAAAAGMHEGEVIVSVDGVETKIWGDVIERVLPKALLRESVVLVTEEHGAQHQYTLSFGGVTGDESIGQLLRTIGLVPFNVPVKPRIEQVPPGSAAEAAGLRPSDLITAVNGKATPDWDDVVAILSTHPNQQVVITYERNGISRDAVVVPKAETHKGKTVGRLGVPYSMPAYPERLIVTVQYDPVESATHAAAYLWDNVAVTFRMIGGMLRGIVSTDQVSGVITIAKSAKNAALAGTSAFLQFLGIVSLSLGVLNLLPIPVLDGGHLAFYLIEMVKGSPVSERTEAIGLKIGLALLLALMTLALYNDLFRHAG